MQNWKLRRVGIPFGISSRVSRPWLTLWLRIGAALLVFSVANWICYFTSGYFAKERSYHAEVDRAIEGSAAPALFVGDSHVATPLQYYDDYLPGFGYSLAFGGDSYREAFAKVRHVLEHSHGVRWLFVTADPHMFGTARLQSSNRSFADSYFLEDRDRSGLDDGLLSALRRQVPLLNDDYIQYLRKKGGLAFHSGAPATDEFDEANNWRRLSGERRAAIATRTGAEDHLGAGEHPEPFEWLSRILSEARSHGVKVIGVRFPVTPEYRAQAPEAFVQRIDAFMRARGALQMVDLRDALSDPADFIDPDHVGPRGARKALAALQSSVVVMPPSRAHNEARTESK